MPFPTFSQTPETLANSPVTTASAVPSTLLIAVGAFYGAALLSLALKAYGWRVARTFCVAVGA